MTDKKFNFDEALKAIQSGQEITGADGVLAPLVKQLTEAALAAELNTYLVENASKNNRKNGYSKKTVKSTSGSFELETPRDRAGEFEPQLVKKNQTKLTEEIDNKIISLYSHGNDFFGKLIRFLAVANSPRYLKRGRSKFCVSEFFTSRLYHLIVQGNEWIIA